MREANVLWFIGIFFLGFIVFIIYFGTKKNPNAAYNAAQTSTFNAQLPEGFGYSHLYDGTGYAINMITKEAYLVSAGVRKTIPLDKIRDFTKRWKTPGQYMLTANTVTGVLEHATINKQQRLAADQGSGLFLSIADIDTPVMQIKFADENALNKAFEIFRQAQEGVLPSVA